MLLSICHLCPSIKLFEIYVLPFRSHCKNENRKISKFNYSISVICKQIGHVSFIACTFIEVNFFNIVGELNVTPARVLNTVFQTATNKLLETKILTRQNKLFNIQSQYGYRSKSRDNGAKKKSYNGNQNNNYRSKSQNRDSRKDKFDKQQNGKTYSKKYDKNQKGKKDSNNDRNKKQEYKKKNNKPRSSSTQSQSQPRSASNSSYHSSRESSVSSVQSEHPSREQSTEEERGKSKEKYKKKIREQAKTIKGMQIMMANVALAKDNPLKCLKCKKAMHPGRECEPLVNVTEMGQQLVDIGNTMQNIIP